MIDRNLALEAVRVTEAAALASARLMGTGDKERCDQAAVDAMRNAYETLDIWGRIVIGEGERDKAPMLYIGEEVGARRKDSIRVDIAVDPLEGTNLCANGQPGAISVLAMAADGAFLHAPDCHMKKIAVGRAARDVIDLRESPTWNLKRIAKAKGVDVTDLTAIMLNRERHHDIMGEVRQAGARIRLISDGDLSAALSTAREGTGIDVLFGIGGAPEGVISAAALKCIGAGFQGQLIFRQPEQEVRAKGMGIRDLDRIYMRDELAQGEVMFAATGITTGELLKGVQFSASSASTHSLVMRSWSGTMRFIEAIHDFHRKPSYNRDGIVLAPPKSR